MLNIFNLFLLLLTLWVLFIFAGGEGFSWFYIFFGFVVSIIVSIIALRARMISKNSEMIYLSLGFYGHFFSIYARNFFSSVRLLTDIAIFHREVSPVLAKIKFHNEKKAPLIASLNMTTGIICIGVNQDSITLHAINHEYLQAREIKKIRTTLSKINDDQLI